MYLWEFYTMQLDYVYPLPPAPSSSLFPSPTQPTPFFCHIMLDAFAHSLLYRHSPKMVILSKTKSLKKVDSDSPGRYQLPITSQLWMRFISPPISMLGFCMLWSYTHWHSYHEFMSTPIVLCLKQGFFVFY